MNFVWILAQLVIYCCMLWILHHVAELIVLLGWQFCFLYTKMVHCNVNSLRWQKTNAFINPFRYLKQASHKSFCCLCAYLCIICVFGCWLFWFNSVWILSLIYYSTKVKYIFNDVVLLGVFVIDCPQVKLHVVIYDLDFQFRLELCGYITMSLLCWAAAVMLWDLVGFVVFCSSIYPLNQPYIMFSIWAVSWE